MKLAALAVLFVSLPALAHIEPGVYKGTTAEGKECSFTAGKQYFDHDMPHPLNERIEISVGDDAFVVGHPPVIDSTKGIAFFNHNLFQAVLPTKTGAKALEIEMVHSEQFEGPVSFTYMEHAWKTDQRSSYKCADIKLVK